MPKFAEMLPGVGFGVAIKTICPDGVPVDPSPAATLLLTLTGVPWLIPFIKVTEDPLTVAVRVVTEGSDVTLDQFFTKFAAFTEPSPVTRS